MSEYASCFTEYLIASPWTVQDRVGDIQTADIDVGQLADGVQLTREENKDAATATQNLLEFRWVLASRGDLMDRVTDC